ncbi:MAG: thioredoxin family protein [Chitinophagaceae bacterium]
MKKIFLAIGVSMFALMAFKPGEELSIGSSMPKATLKLTDISGSEISLQSSTRQNGLLVMFSCNTCPYVIKNQQRTAEICNYAIKSGMGVVILNSNEAYRSGEESLESMKTYAQEQGYKWNYAVDKNNELADAFGANRTPECYLFNKDGKLAYHGAIDDNPSDAGAVQRHHLKEAVTELAQGKEVSVKTSRSVGCSIKRKV